MPCPGPSAPAAGHVEAIAVELLRWAVAPVGTPGGSGRVELLVPDALPADRHCAPSVVRPLEASGWGG